MTTPHRRITDQPWYDHWWKFSGRAWRFWLAPFVDEYKGISITRILVFYFAILIWRAMELGHTIGTNLLWLALAIMAAAFGKSTFSFFLERMRYQGSAEQRDTTAKLEAKTTVDAHYTVDGVPALSNPPVPGAKTLAGDD